MEATIVCRGYTGTMETKMETTFHGLGLGTPLTHSRKNPRFMSRNVVILYIGFYLSCVGIWCCMAYLGPWQCGLFRVHGCRGTGFRVECWGLHCPNLT